MSAPRQILIALLVCAVAVLAAATAQPPVLHRQSRQLMGTRCEIQVYHADALRAAKAMAEALDEMQRVDRLLSNYDPASELSVMNGAASRAPVRVSDELFEFVSQSGDFVRQTRNAFDPTVGPLVRVWGFLTPHPAEPSEQERAEAKARSGFDKVRLDDVARTVFYSVPGMEIDPGGIGKGYAVDRAAQVLAHAGMDSALVSAGGSTLYAIGHPPEREGWRIAIKDPANMETPLAFVSLRDTSVSTSGVSERSLLVGARRYAHIFDPRTGEPVEDMCQASVVAPTATESDALSKAAFVLPRTDVADLLADRTGAHALRVEGPCGTASPVWTTPGSSSVFVRPPSER